MWVLVLVGLLLIEGIGIGYLITRDYCEGIDNEKRHQEEKEMRIAEKLNEVKDILDLDTFKYNSQTHDGEYGKEFSSEISLKDFVNLETGEFLEKKNMNLNIKRELKEQNKILCQHHLFQTGIAYKY